jgi:hypothetical protein
MKGRLDSPADVFLRHFGMGAGADASSATSSGTSARE